MNEMRNALDEFKPLSDPIIGRESAPEAVYNMDQHVQLYHSQHRDQTPNHNYTTAKQQSSVYDNAALMNTAKGNEDAHH